MGSLFSSSPAQQPKSKPHPIKQDKKNQQIQASVSNLSSKQTQSRGEQILQDGEFSFNEEKQQEKPSQIMEGKIKANNCQSQEAIIVVQSGKLIRQVSDNKQNYICYTCNQIIGETVIKVVCQHMFHQECFIELIEKQLLSPERFLIKCKCGTKLNSNILRQIVDIRIRYQFLYQIFSTQVHKLLQTSNIRKLCDLQQINQMIEQNQIKEDYDFNYDQKKAELKKNITEYIVDESGLLQISQQKLFIISVCLCCGEEISSTLLKLNCGHIYHQECFIKWLKQLIDQKKSIIKCRCGTKMNTNIIRRIPESKTRMKFLNYLFSAQLSHIIPKLNKVQDFEQIWDLYYQNQFTEDQDYISTSGFLYFSNYSTPGGD